MAADLVDTSPTSRNVAVVTPWFPNRQLPWRGAFVQAMVEATAGVCDRMTVYHCDSWVATMSKAADKAVDRAFQSLLPHTLRPRPTVGGAELVYVPVPVPRGQSHAEIARREEYALRSAVGHDGLTTPVVHAHVGFYGGWAAIRNTPPGARVFVTEHATFLSAVLAEPAAREMYDEVLSRSTALFAVGEPVRAPLVATFPHHAHRIHQIANPISFEERRPAPVMGLRRWLFVGGLIERKGVTLLLEAFAKCHAEDPTLSLTLVGDGQLSDQLRARAAALGLERTVTLTGDLPPAQALRLMREHDLLVHPSRFETFGVTVVEAIAAGMPVLVTRCGGPEETLAGLASAAAEFIDVDDDPDTIVSGYRRLRARLPGLRIEAARQILADRYSYPSVARAHADAWFPRLMQP